MLQDLYSTINHINAYAQFSLATVVLSTKLSSGQKVTKTIYVIVVTIYQLIPLITAIVSRWP